MASQKVAVTPAAGFMAMKALDQRKQDDSLHAAFGTAGTVCTDTYILTILRQVYTHAGLQ